MAAPITARSHVFMTQSSQTWITRGHVFSGDHSRTLVPVAGVLSARRDSPADNASVNADQAYQRLKSVLASERLVNPGHVKIAMDVLIRVCAFDQADALGSFAEIGRAWARSGRHTALLKQLARVRSH